MSYSHNPLRVSYNLGSVNFDTDKDLGSLTGPEGMHGRVQAVIVDASTTFTDVTTSARVQVGIDGMEGKFADVDMLATASGEGKAAERDELSMLLVEREENLKVFVKAPTGGAPAGVGRLIVVVDWF